MRSHLLAFLCLIALPLTTAVGDAPRIWTDITGQVSREAELVAVQSETVQLRLVDGSVISVPFDKLSTEDQKFLDKQSKTLAGKAVSITDGDTFVLLDADKTQHKIRLEGIDAPEDSQAFSAKSTLALAELIRNKDLRVVWKEKDRYGRILGHIYVGAKWVNLELIKAGRAWHYKEHNKDPQLAQAEVGATTAKAGLWSDDSPIAPWDYRKGIRPEIKAV